MAKFGKYERRVLSLFRVGSEFKFQGKLMRVVFAGKPKCSRGEPKTDVFVRCQTPDRVQQDFKISYKRPSADFVENKTSAERAAELLGIDWASVIRQSTLSLKEMFVKRPIIYKKKHRRTQAGSITLGWKYELLVRDAGELSGKISLTEDQRNDVFSGSGLPEDKRNASVNGSVIKDSGVANYILVTDDLSTLQRIVDQLIPIDEYAHTHEVFYACKALNCRTFERPAKWDGNRPLAVQVDWAIKDGKLTPSLNFDSPLTRKGNEIGNALLSAMKQIGITSTEDITQKNCACVDGFLPFEVH